MSQNLDTKDPPRGVTFWQAFTALAVTGALLFAYYEISSAGVFDGPSRAARPSVDRPGSYKVDRVWTEKNADTGYALVSYTNDTASTFQQVTIQCVALDSADQKLGVNQRSFFGHERGPVGPGFTGTVEVPVRLHGAKMASASCSISSAF